MWKSLRPVRDRGAWEASSEFRWAIARRAVKVDAILGLKNLKAFGNDINLYVYGATQLPKLGQCRC
jgi:hypothetical protein